MKRQRDTSFYLCMVGPAIVIYGIFFVFPILRTLDVSLYRWSGLSHNMTWVGLENFRQILLYDTIFWKALGNNVFFLYTFPVATLIISLALAAVLSPSKERGANLFRSAFYFPSLMSAVAVSILWTFAYHPYMGILNQLLRTLGLQKWIHVWLGEASLVKPSLLVPLIWRSFGFYMVVFMAAMRGIPTDYYDAASIDGATGVKAFWHITIPLIWDSIIVSTVFMIINSLLLFELVWIMTEGGPARHSEVIATYFYRKAFNEFEMGYATAVSVILLVTVFVITLLVRRLLEREAVQY